MEKRNSTIYIAEKIAKIVSSRDLVHNLEKEIARQEYSTVNLDFTDVEFISRSAAHELLVLQEKMKLRTFKKKSPSRKYKRGCEKNDTHRRLKQSSSRIS